MDLHGGEIPKKPIESSSQDQSTAECPSEDTIVEGLPIITRAAISLTVSGELLGKSPFVTFRVFSNIFPDVAMANSDQEPQKDFTSNLPSSDNVKEIS